MGFFWKDKKENREAEKLALLLTRSRQKYKQLKRNALAEIRKYQIANAELVKAVTTLVVKAGGEVLVEKDLLDAVKDLDSKFRLDIIEVKDTPGDLKFRVVQVGPNNPVEEFEEEKDEQQ
jgi:SpoU rRNA methylase family enzyme